MAIELWISDGSPHLQAARAKTILWNTCAVLASSHNVGPQPGRGMSFLRRRLSPTSLRNFRPRASASKESWLGPGKKEPEGLLFGETPPPPGQSRKWESWELPWYVCCTVHSKSDNPSG